MQTDDGINLSGNFLRFYEASGIKSLRQVAILSNCSPSQVRNIASGAYDGSDVGPGVFQLSRLASTLGVTVGDLISRTELKTANRDVKDFFSRYQGRGTPIDNFSDLLPFCDVYNKPTGGRAIMERLGDRSFLVERTGITDVALHQHEYDRWPKARRKRIFSRQLRAWRLGALIEPASFDDRFATIDLEVSTSFLLAACHITDWDGAQRLLVCCEAVSEEV